MTDKATDEQVVRATEKICAIARLSPQGKHALSFRHIIQELRYSDRTEIATLKAEVERLRGRVKELELTVRYDPVAWAEYSKLSRLVTAVGPYREPAPLENVVMLPLFCLYDIPVCETLRQPGGDNGKG